VGASPRTRHRAAILATALGAVAFLTPALSLISPRAVTVQSVEAAELLGALRAAPNTATAAVIAGALWRQSWAETASPTTALLMSRASEATDAGDEDRALALLDAIISIDPGYAEAYNRRATLRYARGLARAALEDLEACVRLNPSHFGAWTSLGAVFEDLGAERAALKAYEQALSLYPTMPEAREAHRRLDLRVNGRAA